MAEGWGLVGLDLVEKAGRGAEGGEARAATVEMGWVGLEVKEVEEDWGLVVGAWGLEGWGLVGTGCRI